MDKSRDSLYEDAYDPDLYDDIEPHFNFRASVKKTFQHFAKFTADVMYDKEEGHLAYYYSFFLRFLSFGAMGFVALKQWLYKNRILRDEHLGCMVIVVGNLTMGGTGKTPVVERLARALQSRGRKVCILSRGYKSKKEPAFHKAWRWLVHKEAAPPKVVSDGNKVLLDSLVAGDEPYMLARNLPGVCVVVDKDRVKAGQYAVKHFGVDTLILDDGFSYYRLKDHLQLLLIDKTNPFGNGCMLPRGILREPIEQLRRANYIILTKSDGVPDPALEKRIREIRPGTELIECTHAPKHLREVFGDRELPLSHLEGKKVACLSAIAAPDSFESFVRRNGASIVSCHRFLDHHRFDRDDMKEVFDDALSSGATLIVTTEKDAVRMEPDLNPPLPMYYLRVEIEIITGAADFGEAVTRIAGR